MLTLKGMNYALIFRRLGAGSLAVAGAVLAQSAFAEASALEPKPNDPYFADYKPVQAPACGPLLLKEGDRLAICGDSITEQKIYSRILETYLTVCVPELKITVRQFGWSGETAEGFLNRMTNDCLRFHPTIATTCYGMNDHRYRAYEDGIGQWYSNKTTEIVRDFKSAGARVIVGAPSCVGKVPGWVKTGSSTIKDMNLSLCTLRNIDIDIAARENVAFADVFWPMFTSAFDAYQKFGEGYGMSGKDGVHPGEAGHLFMARAFLKAMGLDGSLGTFTVDLKSGAATASSGHTVDSLQNGVLTVTSKRYPFCAAGATNDDQSMRSAMALMPFNAELNRFMLVVKGGTAENFKVTWGNESHTYSSAQLQQGVNLAQDFVENPFSKPFAAVVSAVQAKQNYETRQVKDLFHGPEGQADMDGIVGVSEKARERLAQAIPAAFVPVTHTIRIKAQ